MSANSLDFSTYCIGNVAEYLQLNQADVYRRLHQSGILADYADKLYDVAHTYSKTSIIEDITTLMKQRGVL